MSMFYCKFLVKIFANVKANVIMKSQNHFLYLMKMILYIIYIYKCGGKEVKIHLIMSNTPTHPYTHTHTRTHTHIYIYYYYYYYYYCCRCCCCQYVLLAVVLQCLLFVVVLQWFVLHCLGLSWLCISICVCVYVCICVYICVYACVCIYMYVYLHIRQWRSIWKMLRGEIS